MADFKGRKRGKSHVQNMGIFLVGQDMVLSHRGKFQLIIIFFRVKAISTGPKNMFRKQILTCHVALKFFWLHDKRKIFLSWQVFSTETVKLNRITPWLKVNTITPN